MIQRFIPFIFLILLSLVGSAQDWTVHLPFHQIHSVSKGAEEVVCATQQSIFSYFTSDKTILTYSKSEGLSGGTITCLVYSDQQSAFLLGYDDGNLDIYEDGRFENISDIYRKIEINNRSIRKIIVDGPLAFLCCDFGIVTLDIASKQIKETTYFKGNSQYFGVNDLLVGTEFLWAASDNGLYRIDKNHVNRINFSNWNKESLPSSSETILQVVEFENRIIVSVDETKDNAFYRSSNVLGWEQCVTIPSDAIEMKVNSSTLDVATSNAIYSFGDENLQQVSVVSLQSMGIEDAELKDFVKEGEKFWIADENNGLLHIENNRFESIVPEGPSFSNSYSVASASGSTILLEGGIDSYNKGLLNAARFDNFDGVSWEIHDASNEGSLSSVFDLHCVEANQNMASQFYIGTWGSGLLEYNKDKDVSLINSTNSSLKAYNGNVYVGGIDCDKNGTLWVTNPGVTNAVSSRNTSGEWNSFYISPLANKLSIRDIVVVGDGSVWVNPGGNSGLVAFSETGGQSQSISVVARFSNNEGTFDTQMNNVLCFDSDAEERLWIGTDNGVAYYYRPNLALTDDVYAIQPSLQLNDGLFHPLLENEEVTCIAIDEADRKWFGTKGNGVFLISSDGDLQIEHFTVSNSSLLSNEINSISVDKKSGEVFFASSEGLVCYQGDAIETNEDFTEVLVYPNPVRPEYRGDVTIDGLIDDSDVRITDIAGNLVCHLKAQGGRALWDGNNRKGQRVSTGVYLIFMADQLGEQNFVSKVLFIN